MRRTLILASVFPPGSTSAGIRCGKLARAAVRAGISVRFVHPGDRADRYEWRDGVWCTTFRAPVATRVFRRQRAMAEVGGAGSPGEPSGRVTRWGRRTVRALLQPDEYVLDAAPFARALVAEAALARAAGERPIMLACSPPWSTTLPARWAAREAGLPLVLDLQDLWSENPVARWTLLGRRVARRLERDALAAAAGFVFINEAIDARYRRSHPETSDRPSVVAHIGVESPHAGALTVEPHQPFELLHIGSIYGDRDISGLLDACIELRRAGRDVALSWYGTILGEHPLRRGLADYAEAGALRLHAPIPHEAARERMRRADMLVTVPSPVYEEELTGKLFDYLDAGRPILALAPRSSYIAEVLGSTGVGTVVPPTDRAGLRALLSRLMTEGAVYQPNPRALSVFTLDTIGARIRALAELVCP